MFSGDIDCFTKLALPVAVNGELIGQTAFATEKLFTNARENVNGRFVAIKTNDKCLAVFNRGTYGNHFENGILYLSLTRGVSYCAHPILDRPVIPSDRFVEKIDQGERNFAFRIAVVDECELERTAQEFNQTPYALNAFPIPYGEKALPFEFKLSNKNVTLVTIKKGEDVNGFVIRLLNNNSENAECELKLNGNKLLLEFTKYEVKTVIYDNTLKEIKELVI